MLVISWLAMELNGQIDNEISGNVKHRKEDACMHHSNNNDAEEWDNAIFEGLVV